MVVMVVIVVRMKVRVVKIVGSIVIRMVVSNCSVAFVTEKNHSLQLHIGPIG